MDPRTPTPEQVKAEMMFQEELDKTSVSVKLTMRQAIVIYNILVGGTFKYGDFEGISKIVKAFQPTVDSIKLQDPRSNPSPNHVVEPTILGSKRKN